MPLIPALGVRGRQFSMSSRPIWSTTVSSITARDTQRNPALSQTPPLPHILRRYINKVNLPIKFLLHLVFHAAHLYMGKTLAWSEWFFTILRVALISLFKNRVPMRVLLRVLLHPLSHSHLTALAAPYAGASNLHKMKGFSSYWCQIRPSSKGRGRGQMRWKGCVWG